MARKTKNILLSATATVCIQTESIRNSHDVFIYVVKLIERRYQGFVVPIRIEFKKDRQLYVIYAIE